MEKAKKLTMNLYANDTLKWAYEGKRYCLHVQQDENAINPRVDYDNITIMACWHWRYALGDDLNDDSPTNFWRRLVRENVPESEVWAAAQAGKLTGIRIVQDEDDPKLFDVYEVSAWHTALGENSPKECLEWTSVNKNTAVYYLLDNLTISHCMTLMEPYAVWLPLWLYDHGGITMSCGTRTGCYTDRWDSGQVGWIVALKETILKEAIEYVLDENGERIKVEHRHEGQSPTWSYLTRPLTEETWRKRAIEIMESDVEQYDQYLTNDVYGFTLYEAEDDGEEPDWQELDSTWSYFGSNIVENGILEEAGHGLKEALLSGQYKQGEAKLHTSSYYTF